MVDTLQDIDTGSPVSQPPTLSKILLKATGLALVFAAGLLLLTFLVVGLVANHQLTLFTRAADISRKELFAMVTAGLNQTPTATDQHKNILLLGVDSLVGRGNVPPLTDSMQIVSVDLQTGKITMLPLPRDLYHPEYQTKINALYAYGADRYPDRPEQFPTEVVTEMTGVPIHHTIVLSMDQVAELIDAMGGVEVEVPTGFTDTTFPRTDVDIHTVTDPAALYETISFNPGTEVMSGQRALQYMRSRTGDNDQNTDIARSHRQQLVIQSLLKQLMQPSILTNPTKLGELFALYQTEFGAALPATELITTGKALFPSRKNISVTPVGLSIYPENPEGLIEHPPTAAYGGQWVYRIRDAEAFPTAVQELLY